MCRAIFAAFVGLALVSLLPANSRADTSGDSDVNLLALATVEIDILDASIDLEPDHTDYENGFVVAEGADGIAVRVRTNSATGMVLSLKTVDGTPGIHLADIDFKTETAVGGTGSRITDYTTLTGSDQSLWTSDEEQPAFTTIDTDIKVSDLWNYLDDGDDALTTTFTTTLTYTVTVQ